MRLRSRLDRKEPRDLTEELTYKNTPSPFQVVCEVCGDTYFMDELTFLQAVTAMQAGVADPFCCNSCGGTTNSLIKQVAVTRSTSELANRRDERAHGNNLTLEELSQIEELARRSHSQEAETILRLSAALREAMQVKEGAIAVMRRGH